MADRKLQQETIDVRGETVHINETFTTSEVARPAVASGVISEVLIDVLETEDDDTGDLLVSFDGGTLFKRIHTGGALIWSVKGRVTQIKLKTTSGSIDAELLINREDP